MLSFITPPKRHQQKKNKLLASLNLKPSMNLFIHLLSLIIDGVSPVVLNLAEHDSLEPRLDLRGVPSRLAVRRQGVDISFLVADHGNRGNEVLKG